MPSVTEILYSIGAQDRLVGVTDFCDYPAAARQKPRVGGMLAPSLEGMVSLKPDLVVATTAGNRHETFEQLERLRIPVYVVNPVSVADVLDLLARLGRLTDRTDAADRAVAVLRERMQAVATRGGRAPPPARALRPLARPAHRARAWLARVRADHPGRRRLGDRRRRPRLSALQPRGRRWRATPRSSSSRVTARSRARWSRDQWERFTQVPAIAAGRLHTIDGNLTHRYGPRIVDGLERLARLIHPEAFDRAETR